MGDEKIITQTHNFTPLQGTAVCNQATNLHQDGWRMTSTDSNFRSCPPLITHHPSLIYSLIYIKRTHALLIPDTAHRFREEAGD